MDALVTRIANAVLYEGYLLYPYRASAIKNRQRFNFGVLFPEDYCAAHPGSESSRLQCECLVVGERPMVRANLRYLQLIHRQVETASVGETESKAAFRPVDSLDVAGVSYQTWQEAGERELCSPEWDVKRFAGQEIELDFSFSAGETHEPIHNERQETVGRLTRKYHAVHGVVTLNADNVSPTVHRLRIAVDNVLALPNADKMDREQALLSSLASAHLVLTVDRGRFVSLLDPPQEFDAAVKNCSQVGCFPVLVGAPGEQHTMLASPIILYDYPEIAAESPGDFFDGTEIDEMLMLRILTMTPDEQREMRQIDEQARRLLERTQQLSEPDFLKLHGKLRESNRTMSDNAS